MPAARIVLWVASIGAVATLARTLLVGPLPVTLAIALLVLYLGIMLVGLAKPQLEMYGDAVWRGQPGQRLVALTFDDGPHPTTTRAVLSILNREGVKATFFLVGRKVDQHPDVVREIHDAGHTLGLHGYLHSWGYAMWPPSQVLGDLRRAQEAVHSACGVRPRLFRPPIGVVSPRTAKGAARAGVPIVLWSVKGADGVRMPVDTVVRRVHAGLSDGAIVLLHDAAENDDREPASIEALPRILSRIRELRLEPVGVERFVPGSQEGPAKGPAA